MITLEYDEKEILSQIDKVVKRTMRMDMTWDWPCGVAYYGIGEAYAKTKNKEYLSLLKDRVDELIEMGLPTVWTVNACAMGHCLISLFEATKEAKYWDILMSKIQYLRKDAIRFGDNVLQHTVSANNDFPEQAWADTLFMAAFLLLRVGIIENDEEMIEDALNQYYWHIHYLQNKITGLFYHGYNNIEKNNMSGFYWGRANAWAAYTMSKVDSLLQQAYLYPKFLEIVGSINEQLSALKYLQTENGLWRTILDDTESYEEVSASCGIAAAMLEKGNPFYIKSINRFTAALKQNISVDGKILNVSGGTAVMKDRNGYCMISKEWIQGWGQGLALTFLAALVDNSKKRKDGAL